MSRSNLSPLRQRAYHFLSRRIAIFLLLVMGSCASRSVAQQAIADRKIGDLKITILSTMLVSTAGGTGEWGFSALVQADGHQALVDTGAAPTAGSTASPSPLAPGFCRQLPLTRAQ